MLNKRRSAFLLIQGLAGLTKRGRTQWVLASLFACFVAFAGKPVSAGPFDAFFAFGDSTLDSGWWAGALNGQCGLVPAPCTTGNLNRDQLISNAIANGGTGAPVGVGLMNSQIIAQHYGLTALPANQPGGTNYAISGALSATVNGSGNLNPNPNLPSTVNQIGMYLTQTGGVADQQGLYVISSGGNDRKYAQNNFGTLAQQESFLATQANSLAAELKVLQKDGALHLVVYGAPASGTLATFWTDTLFSDLTNDGVSFIGVDLAAFVAEVEANPTQYGFTAATVLPGVLGSGTGSACVTANGSGWGQWCANTTIPSSNYAHLRASDSEQTSFYSDDEHFSAAGQLLEANYVIAQIPVPGTLPLLAGGLCALGLLGWRRMRSAVY